MSELHSRLEHLVTYSSQLIFISGDTIGEQQHALHSFLGKQSESTEVAFINAEADASVQSYRRQICTQLNCYDSALFNRPLRELLAPLNHQEGAVLICICQAEQLPSEFLQELWDLVLLSRAAGSKQHLNVLLFGQPQWAEQAKSWLPARNRDKPLLLSTESITPTAPPASELDALIAKKRQAFAQRLAERTSENQESVSHGTPAITTWWFRLLIGLGFLSAFSGILMWQYSDQVTTLWQPAAQQKAEPDAPPTSPPPVTQSPQAPQNVAASGEEESLYELVPSADISSPAQPAPVQESQAGTSQLPADQARVMDWQSASRAIETEAETEAETADLPEQNASESQALLQQEAQSDYPVEDIVSPTTVLLAENTDEIKETAQEPALESPLTTESENILNEVAPDAAPTLPLLEVPDNQFVVQLGAMADETALRAFVANLSISEKVWIYRTTRFGGDWHVVLAAESFDSLADARAAISRLSEQAKGATPFVKSMSAVKQELGVEGSRQLQ